MATEQSIYQDIAVRTGGNIYIGVVGPVRTGKSTLVKALMEHLVLPSIKDPAARERARDELPQSAGGRTITTSEPKFIPEKAAEITVSGAVMKIRLADCVGYMVEGALGGEENGEPRLVDTPWFGDAVALPEAAEEGTRRVMRDHATVGLVVTSDGTVTDLPREAYAEAETRVIAELRDAGKPYLVLLNSREPAREETQALADRIAAETSSRVLPVDILHLSREGIEAILRTLLFEFPVGEIGIDLPDYLAGLPLSHPASVALREALLSAFGGVKKIRDLEGVPAALGASEAVESSEITSVDLATGEARFRLSPPRTLYFRLLSDALPDGCGISSDDELLPLLADLAAFRKKYERFASALDEAYEKGYSALLPSREEMKLEEPEIVRKGGRFGVRLSASAPSLHVMRADIHSTVTPIVGSEKQSEELVDYILGEFEDDPAKLWDSNIFGKSLHELINEGLAAKIAHVSGESGVRFRETLERVINEGSGGMICIIL